MSERAAEVQQGKHTFSVDRYGWVVATGADGGMLKSQSVEALLLHAILLQLRALEGVEPPTNARGPGLVYVCQRTTDVVRGCGPDASQWCAECPQRAGERRSISGAIGQS